MTGPPRTRREWQEAVDGAHFFLTLDASRAYGLTTGGPAVDVERCAEILRRGDRRGIRPSADAIERGIAELAADGGVEAPPCR